MANGRWRSWAPSTACTRPRFMEVVQAAGARVSLDARGRWMDNVFIERLRRSLKYECVYLPAFETGSELRAGLGRWISYYNTVRPHSAHGGKTLTKPTERPGRTSDWQRETDLNLP